jgi:autotransporter-associated beta strand protein
MKNKFPSHKSLHRFLPSAVRISFCAVLAIAGLTATSKVQAASQSWTNAPADNTWTNILNWNAKAVPGNINPASSGLSADIATFTNAIPVSGIGGAGNPITNDYQRDIGGLIFDGANCGAYVFGNSLNDNFIEITQSHYIAMNPPVVNPIVFNQGLQTRLPSSTNGRYDLTNNATSPNATFFFAAITNASSSTRPLALWLSGSNTGTNTIARLDDNNGGNGCYQINKWGAGRWILSGPNDLPQKTSAGNVAGVFVEAGTLEVKDPGSLGSITAANLQVAASGTLQIDGVTLNNAGITLYNGGTIKLNGSGTVNGIAVNNAASSSDTLATTSAADVMTVGTAANQPSGGAADTVLHVAGPGTVALAQSASYIGKWSVDAGTLQLNGGTLGTGANLNIAAGATFDVSPLGANYTLATAALSASGTGMTVGSTAATINAAAGATFDLATGSKPISMTYTPTSFTGDSVHPAIYVSQGVLALSGNSFTVNNASGTPLGVGTYTLIQVPGGVTDGGGYAVAVKGSGKAAGTVAAIQVSGGNVNLVITAYIANNLVWTGGAANANWDVNADANWLNGAAVSVYNQSDNVLFNSVGSTNPIVTLVSTLAPGSVTVDTSANTYTFSGSGVIAGTTGLTKMSSGTLILNTVNTYSGNTVVSNGIIQLGVANAIPGNLLGGDVTITNTGVLDMNGLADTINGLNGNGKVDNVAAGGASVLSIGNNNDGGTFSGVIQNTTGTVGLTLVGNGVETLTAANTYSGNTTINAGTLRVSNYYALGSGASTVNVSGGTLDVATNVLVGIFGGTGGTIANNTTTFTNTLVVTNSGTVNAVIADGTGGGGIKILVSSGTLRLNAANTFSGGTILASGAGLAIGGGTANAGAGGVICSNLSTVSQVNSGSGSSGPGNTFTTVDGATVTFYSSTTANNYGGQFVGSAFATNVFANGNMSIGGATSFAGFLGTVIISNGTVRMYNASGGGDNTIFVFTNSGGMFTRDADTIHLGALFGNGQITGPSVTPSATYWIGAKGIDSEYSGIISGSNNIVKTGVGKLILDGAAVTTNTDSSTYTNYLYAADLSYLGTTTVSNGVLALSVPNNLNNSPSITLAAASAELDASNMGYVTNFNDINSNPDSALVTNGIFELVAATPTIGTPQTLNGIGVIKGSLLADNGSTVNPGNRTGLLNITGSVEIAGAVNMNLDRTNAATSSEIGAGTTLTIDNTATLVVTNIGPGLFTGTRFNLFSKPIAGAGFVTVTLPATDPTGLTNYVWANNLAVDGTIKLTSGGLNPVATNPTNILATVAGNVLTIAWPADHTGWYLQVQTNSISTGLAPAASNWFTITNSALVNTTNFTINPANGSVFYRISLNP